jgi:hypothetical protein
MPLPIKDLHTVDSSGEYVVEVNVSIPLPTAVKSTLDSLLVVRANVYRPKFDGKFPVLVTYGPCKFFVIKILASICLLTVNGRWKGYPLRHVRIYANIQRHY